MDDLTGYEDEFNGSCDCCDVSGGLMKGMAWGTSFMIWLFSIVALLVAGQYAAAAVAFIAGMTVMFGALFGWL